MLPDFVEDCVVLWSEIENHGKWLSWLDRNAPDLDMMETWGDMTPESARVWEKLLREYLQEEQF